MDTMLVVRVMLLFGSLQVQLADFTDPGCVIELWCRECVPDAMPLVESHRAAAGVLRAAAGDELALACRGSRFAAYPARDTLLAVCEAGRFRVRHDNALRHLLELGCQENLFEDVLHEIEHCAPPYQGRAYQTATAHGTRHLATLCFDADLALPRAARASAAGALALRPHRDGAAPRSLLGNFNQMFDTRTRADAERLYSDAARLNRRLRELLKHDDVTLADQELVAAPLLPAGYFEDQDMRVAEFPSGLVAAWRGVARGNLRRLQRDVAARLTAARGAHARLDVWAGTHGTMSLRAGAARRPLLLAPGRFPVPRYLWAVLHAPERRRALALVLLNDPFVAVSEIREAVFCESACARAPWLRELLANRNYESPALGLVFCCDVHSFAAAVPEMPRAVLAAVPPGADGMLLDELPRNASAVAGA